MHELGHQLGLDDSYAFADRDNLMYGFLVMGERRLPAYGQADGAEPHEHDHEGLDFLTSPINLGTLVSFGSTIQVRFAGQVVTTPTAGQVTNQGTVTATGVISVQTDDPSPSPAPRTRTSPRSTPRRR